MAEVPVSLGSGVVLVESGSLVVALDTGARVSASWPAAPLTAGDRVQVLLVDGRSMVVPVAVAPRAATGFVAGAAVSGTVPVDTAYGRVDARYTGTAPSTGTLVALVWSGSTPIIMPGTLAATPTEQQSIPVPTRPDVPRSGVSTFAAIGSGTYNVTAGVWDRTRTSQVQQGSWSGSTVMGAWWYGASPSVLAGRTITRARVRIAARARIGSYNAAAVLHLWRHLDPTQPGGAPSLVEAATDLTIPPISAAPPRFAGDPWVDIPPGIGQSITDLGGGLGITGTPYAGVDGVPLDPTSGQLELTWEA